MAAYGALVSLSHLLHQILHPPPLFNSIIVIHSQQTKLLLAKVESLIHFLETHPTRRRPEIAELEARIRDAAYAAADIIESNIIDQIHASDLYRGVEASTPSSLTKKISTFLSQRKTPILSTQGLESVLEKFISIEEEKELLTTRVSQGVGDFHLGSPAAAGPPPPSGMVGFDDHLLRITREIAGDEFSRKAVLITEMGGIGKTTLASAVYNDLFVAEHFHVRAWVTVSQEYDVQELILCLLSEINKSEINKSFQDEQESSNDEPGLQLYKKLLGRKYLIVMDDMWDVQSWNGVKRFLPDNENGSRILVTSRLSNLADDFGSCTPYEVGFLNTGQSWDLFCKKVFGQEDCPVELEGIGKHIAGRCQGLPLAIVSISGLLTKNERTRARWEAFAGDMASSMNLGGDEAVMKIISSSYTHLPVYLKSCFLYLAVFPQDYDIRGPWLVNLWIAEGLIKPSKGKCLEEIGNEYLEDLVSRNLILVGDYGSNGSVKFCKLHNLVMDFCIAEAEKEEFVCIAKLDSPDISPNLKTARRLSVHPVRGRLPQQRTVEALQSASLNRSWLSLSLREDDWLFKMRRSLSTKGKEKRMINGFRLLKVAYERDSSRRIELLNLSNLRYVSARSISSISAMLLCWNLQTFIYASETVPDVPPGIWQMPQLRHLKTYTLDLPSPPEEDDENMIVLENLQTIKGVRVFKITEHVVKRIPNLKKLKVFGSFNVDLRLHNLALFQKLESLHLIVDDYEQKLLPSIAFPISIRKLSLYRCRIPWGDLSIVGSLPYLEVLKIHALSTVGEEWNPIEGQFCRLKFLLISTGELKVWGAENYHFPCLERLVIINELLETMPLSFSEILTLEEVKLALVPDSLMISARDMAKRREQLGYKPLRRQPRLPF